MAQFIEMTLFTNKVRSKISGKTHVFRDCGMSLFFGRVFVHWLFYEEREDSFLNMFVCLNHAVEKIQTGRLLAGMPDPQTMRSYLEP